MSFGSKEKKIKAATRPYGFRSPYGNVGVGEGNIAYNPIQSSTQKQMEDLTDSRLLSTLQNLPQSYDVNQAFDNPFYKNTADYLRAPVERQYTQDQKELTDSLNAGNQLGSSYAALRFNNLQQNRDYNLAQAEREARDRAASTYQQAAFQNPLAILQGLRGERNAALEAMYAPAKLALGFQGAAAGGQQQLANYYNRRNPVLEALTSVGQFL